jgi:hypothetical protein
MAVKLILRKINKEFLKHSEATNNRFFYFGAQRRIFGQDYCHITNKVDAFVFRKVLLLMYALNFQHGI